ncbi:MAG: nucleotidyl transferase AbiEii/AbiGii toxin family protein [Anaerolineae bacterium]|nr:nucleotidyl transferase AbiEii/AbiGii toxin family protein [Anaerolineae bacterium]
MAVLNPHREALTPETRQAFAVAARLPFIGRYYLAGGTGLALHLGHRFSVDLDFFSPALDATGPEERAILRLAFDDPSLTISVDQDRSFVATWRGVGISFFNLALYPLVQEPMLVEDVPVATIEEIGAMKLAAIIGRGTRKDYLDLYFILQESPLERLFEVAAVKYARVRTFPVSAVRALTYFSEAEATPMPQMIRPVSWPAVKRFLERQALEVGRRHLEDLWPE